MEVEHDIKVIPIDENLQANVEALAKERWELLPGIKPVAIYHVARAKLAPNAPATPGQPPTGLGQAHLKIDDTKVVMLGPDGKPKQ